LSPRWAAGLLALAAGLLLARLAPNREAVAGPLTWDFAQRAYLHPNPAGVRFENGAWLADYAYAAEAIQPGGALEVTLEWRASGPGEATLELLTPAANRIDTAPAFASQSLPLAPGRVTYRLALPAESPAGLVAPRLTLSAGRALTPDGQSRGPLFLRPLRITPGRSAGAASPASLNATATSVIPGPQGLQTRLRWWTERPLSRNLAFSLRLTGPAGRVVAQLDGQPGYGYLPSSGWPAGRWVDDWLSLPLPADLASAYIYPLTVQLYDPAGGSALLVRRLAEVSRGADGAMTVSRPRASFEAPADMLPAEVTFGPDVRLLGYRLAQTADKLDMTLVWQALRPPAGDYVHFVHLVDPDSDQVLAQHDGMPVWDTYPTSQWSAGQVVADPARLDVAEVPPGEYHLVAGLYLREGAATKRLPALDGAGRPLPEGAFLLPQAVTIGGSP
ncbi:MAG: hypothetical protein ACRDHL_09065, partial [Candidatus Promineifilaceae bacterium]